LPLPTQYYIFNNDQIPLEQLAHVLTNSELNDVVKVRYCSNYATAQFCPVIFGSSLVDVSDGLLIGYGTVRFPSPQQLPLCSGFLFCLLSFDFPAVGSVLMTVCRWLQAIPKRYASELDMTYQK
jgi:hypothetical protein